MEYEGFNDGKVYVDVTVRFGREGTVSPVSFIWEDGMTYEIDRVLGVRRSASTAAGGNGILYICMISGKKSHLYYEENNRWFMEKRKSREAKDREAKDREVMEPEGKNR